jgi:hypothetical protein
MPRMLQVMIPYLVAVFGAVAIFVGGAYAAIWLMGHETTPRFGVQQVAELVTNHFLLSSLDAGNVDAARSLLISQEDVNLMALDMLAPYLAPDLAKTTCRIMQKVAKQRADNVAKYSAKEASSDPGVRQMVAASLQNPAACGRPK